MPFGSPAPGTACSASLTGAAWGNFGALPKPPCSASKAAVDERRSAAPGDGSLVRERPRRRATGCAPGADSGPCANAADTRAQDVGEPMPLDEGAAAEDIAVGRQERGGRPAAEAVALADIGPAIGVDADRRRMRDDQPAPPADPRRSRDPSRRCCRTRSVRSTAAPACLRPRARANDGGAPRKPGDSGRREHERVNYNDAMLALRYAAVLALAFWMGGLVALGAVAAPATFDVLGARGARGPAARRQPSSARLLRAVQPAIAYGCAAVVLLSLAVRGVLGPRPRRFAYARRRAAADDRRRGLCRRRAGAADRRAAAGRSASAPSALDPDRSATRRVRPAARHCRCRCSSCPCSAGSRSCSGN